VSARTFFAPGKLMLAGEYSVLGPGGVALAVAVPLGVEASATPSDTWQLVRWESGISWSEGAEIHEVLRFAHAAWRVTLESLPRILAPHRIVTRSVGGVPFLVGREGEGAGPGSPGSGKPGVGGSASASVAITAALLGLAGGDVVRERETILRLALRSHRDAQGGRGSGYDVATAVQGGVLLWRPSAAAEGGGMSAAARRVEWPTGLHLLAGYSGESAPTAPLLAQLEALAGGERARLDGALATLGRPVARLVEAVEVADLEAISVCARACQAALEDWDEQWGLGIITPAIRRMIATAESLGAAAKVSGAGGGDSVLALSARSTDLERVARAWRAQGFGSFPVVVSREGVIERESAPGG
jgi:phosphomevalonate kinase